MLAVTRDEGIIPRDELDRRDTSSSDKSKYLRVEPGDLAYNTMRMWQGVSGVSSYEGIVSPAYTVCELRDSHHPEFMGYLCKLPLLVARFHAYSQGIVSDTLNLRFQNFGEIVAPIPPPEEQRKIAAILSSVDEAIAATRKVIEQTTRVKKGLLQIFMTRGLGHTKFKQTDIGEVPEAWEVVPLKVMLESRTYGISSALSTEPVGTPVVRMGNLSGGRLDLTDLKYADLAGESPDRVYLEPGDILFNRTNSFDLVGKSALVDTDRELSYASYLIRLRPNQTVDPRWLVDYLNCWHGQRIVSALAQPSVSQANINPTALSKARFPRPPRGEQEQISRCLEELREAVAASRRTIEALSTLKRGLMQDLLTGRVRVQPD